MNASLTHADGSQIPFESLIQLTKQQLGKLRVWSGASSITDAAVLKFLADFNITTPRDLSVVTRNMVSRAIKYHEDGNKFVWGNAESIIHSKGGSLTYKKDSVTVELPNEVPIQYVTTSGYPVVNPRPYLSGVLAICASNFQINKGVLSFAFDFKAMAKVFPRTLAAFDPLGFEFVHSVLLSILEPDQGYKTCVAQGRGMSGLAFWDYVASVLQSCPFVDYIALHDTICKRLLFTVEVRTNPNRRPDGSSAYLLGARIKRADNEGVQQNIITEQTVRFWPRTGSTPEWTEALREAERKFGHRPFVLCGSIPQGHAWLKLVGDVASFTEKDVYAAYATRRALHASGTNGAMAVIQSNGFSSIASKVSNRCVLLITLLMNALESCKYVDVRCEMADLAYLEAGIPLVIEKHHDRVRYLMDYSMAVKVPVTLRPFVITNPRPEAHYIAWLDADIDSVPKGTEVSVHFDLQYRTRMEHVPENSTVMVPITSSLPFAKSPDPAKAKYTRQVSLWRGPGDFQAIVSSLPLIKRYTTKEGLDSQDRIMPQVGSWNEFLRIVVSVNASYATWFLAPQSFYTCASNLIRTIAKSTSLRLNDGLWTAVAYEEREWVADFLPDVIASSNIQPIVPQPFKPIGSPPPPLPPFQGVPQPFKPAGPPPPPLPPFQGGRGRGGKRKKQQNEPIPKTPLAWVAKSPVVIKDDGPQQPQPNGSSGPYVNALMTGPPITNADIAFMATAVDSTPGELDAFDDDESVLFS
jgi:hypothetical protein